ncbi:WXG100 family type VII secretion target [Streptomyces sp. NPDC048172]|uniref:WXG100 family type VII secretion target n=1 Tax=Streptomyces sp. NPDC048172 TaxID=3365505 RepID=UPI00371C36FF
MAGDHGDHLKVTYASLDAAADDLDREARELRADLAKVMGVVKKICDGWDGMSNENYLRVQKMWNAKADDLERRLTSIAGAVRMASGDYRATDKKAAGLFDLDDMFMKR